MKCGKENRFTRLVERASLLGTSLGQFASADLREKQRDISTLSPPTLMITGVEEVGTLERGCFYAASGIMGSPLLQFAWLCRK
ncbi:hypothetical protein AMECASPLE_005202 [Ameca splendens]|uniref:Uncharacterized protein n=1 Tax=Ameca splendens TaxID=208324 RepID=A0ABV0XN64_9TELE